MPPCPSCGQLNPARARFCMSCAEPLPPPSPVRSEARKTLTVLFCDVVGSTPIGERLDPESVRKVMTRFFEQMRSVLERHGGTVEKYIGDAVMGLFGVPVLHEDDALRAVRAAAEMQTALDDLNAELEPAWDVVLRTRIGINTGEVVVGGSAGSGFVVGDAVNVAARLEQTAEAGEILLGPDTYALVRDAVTVDDGRSLSLKGKTDPVIGYRLIDVAPTLEPGRRQEPAFVGRERELETLRAAFDRSVRERVCSLVTVLGTAGVGKSRLAREFVASVQSEARIVRGRCLPYGDGITFWPIAEMVREACGITGTDSRDAARSKMDTTLLGDDEASLIADRVAAVSGFGETSAGMQETFWAIRRFLESLQRGGAVVVVFDDVQWAEPTFLDLVEYLSGWTRDARILLLCLARPDLLELRPSWTTVTSTAGTLSLSPLTEEETERLIANLLGASSLDPTVSARIVDAAEGNPLFVEEMLRMLEDQGFLRYEDDRWRVVGDLSRISVPATIQALLAARLDRLTPEEKAVLGCAAVIGKVFWWGAVSELSPESVAPAVGTHLQTLVRKGLIRPDRSSLVGEDAFRFHHILIQEAAYQGLPKERRAELHEGFAAWIERRAGDRLVEYEEVVGYHLEQAYRYRGELGARDEQMGRIAEHASERLASAGRRALTRGDMAAAANLLERACSLCPPDGRARLSLLPDLSKALSESGDLTGADEILSEAISGADSMGDRGLKGHATIARLLLMESTDPKNRSAVALRELDTVIPVFDELGDDLGLAQAWRLMADVHWTRARYAAVDEALERAIDHARIAGAGWEEAESLGLYTGSGLFGPAPVPEVVERCERILRETTGNRVVEAHAFRSLAALRAMEGRFDEARELARRASGILEDLGLSLRAAFVSETFGFIERLAGDAEAAERELRAGFDVIEKLGEQGYLSTVAALLAHSTLDQGRLDDAERFISASQIAAAEDDLTTQVLLRSARGRALAGRGDLEEAERSGREAVALSSETDDVNMRADVMMDLGDVLRLTDRPDDATHVFEGSLSLYRGKGNQVSARRAEDRLGELGHDPSR
jgi:class 3 adenylate cyclase/tetratricopeptide (TPR) repeat protein